MIVTVTAQHIAAGHRQHPRFNPLALAIAEATGQTWHVSSASPSTPGSGLAAYRWGVTEDEATLDWRHLPDICAEFLDDFDVYRSVVPFAFEMPDMPETMQEPL